MRWQCGHGPRRFKLFTWHCIWQLDCHARLEASSKMTNVNPEEDECWRCSTRKSTDVTNCVTWCIKELVGTIAEGIIYSKVADS